MGIRADFHLVDWDRFLCALRKAGGLENYWLEHDEGSSDEITNISMPLHECWSAANVPWDLHDSFASQLTEATRRPFDALLEAFGIINAPQATPHDILEEANTCISMSPSTVRQVAAECSRIDYKELWEVLSPHLHCSPHGPFPDYDSFEEYLEGFVDLLTLAISKGSGIIVTFDV